MNKLSVLLEAYSEPQLIIGFPGRFQPMHKGHFNAYQKLLQFSKNVFIITSDVANRPGADKGPNPSYFNNDQKQKFFDAYGIPSSKVLVTSNMYGQLQEIFPDNIYAYAMGKGDFVTRLKRNPELQIHDTPVVQEYAYKINLGTFDFPLTISGQTQILTSASQLRNAYKDNARERESIIVQMWGEQSIDTLKPLLDRMVVQMG